MREQPWHICVLIPARDEEALIERCLRSVLAASYALPAPHTTDIVIVVDSSIDRTAKIAIETLERRGAVVNANVRTVGTARALAAECAMRRYAGPLDRLWLANTDADCMVPPGWLAEQLRIAEGRTEAIAGTVNVDSFEEHEVHVAERFRATYLIRPDGSHPHIHGANLGVRGDAYIAAGGWANLSTAEDHDLWRRLVRNGSAVVATSQIEVTTSGRRVGRAPHGFADALAAHNATHGAFTTALPTDAGA